MRARIEFSTIDEEAVKTAELMNVEPPKPHIREEEIYFRLDWIEIAHLTADKEIVIYCSSGSWILEYDEDVWNKIKDHLMNDK